MFTAKIKIAITEEDEKKETEEEIKTVSIEDEADDFAVFLRKKEPVV